VNNHLGIILTSIDDASTAKTLANQMVTSGLAACVQISARGTSVYRWQGEVQESGEYFLSIKTAPEKLYEIKQWLERHHPYDIPEIIVLEGRTSEQYAAWIKQSTSLQTNTENEANHA